MIEILKARLYEALPGWYGRVDNEIVARINHELELINKFDLSGYFLLLGSVCREAANQGILLGPVTGYATGLLSAFLLSITQVDPIEFNLRPEFFFYNYANFRSDIPLSVEVSRVEDIIEIFKKLIVNDFPEFKYGFFMTADGPGSEVFDLFCPEQKMKNNKNLFRVQRIRPCDKLSLIKKSWPSIKDEIHHGNIFQCLGRTDPWKFDLIKNCDESLIRWFLWQGCEKDIVARLWQSIKGFQFNSLNDYTVLFHCLYHQRQDEMLRYFETSVTSPDCQSIPVIPDETCFLFFREQLTEVFIQYADFSVNEAISATYFIAKRNALECVQIRERFFKGCKENSTLNKDVFARGQIEQLWFKMQDTSVISSLKSQALSLGMLAFKIILTMFDQ